MTTDTPDEPPGSIARIRFTTCCDVCGAEDSVFTEIETYMPHNIQLCDACIDAAVALRTKEIEEAIR